MRRMVLAALLTASAGTGLAQPAPQPPADPALKAAVAKMQDGDFAGSYALVKPLTQARDLRKRDNAYRHAAWYVLGVDASFLDKPQEALAALRLSSAMPNAGAEDWYARLLSAQAAGQRDDQLLSLTTLAESYPDFLGPVTDELVARTLRAAAALPSGADRRSRLMGALAHDGWQPKAPSLDDWSFLWAEDAAHDLDQGDSVGAAEAAKRATWPKAVIAMRADKRFDALRAAAPTQFDVQAAYDARIAEAQAAADARPHSLEMFNALIGALMIDQRFTEALARAEKAAAAGDAAFDDPGDLNWTLDLKSRALFALGRADDGLATLTQAAELPEGGGPNVSQRLALANRLLALDRPKDALTETAKVLASPDVSSYGRLGAEQVAACADARLDDRPALAKSLAALRERQVYGPQLLLQALVCADDRPGAAALLAQRLADPATRLEALTAVQAYPLADGATPYEQTQHERLTAVLALPEVKTAIDKVGRAEAQPRPEIDW